MHLHPAIPVPIPVLFSASWRLLLLFPLPSSPSAYNYLIYSSRLALPLPLSSFPPKHKQPLQLQQLPPCIACAELFLFVFSDGFFLFTTSPFTSSPTKTP